MYITSTEVHITLQLYSLRRIQILYYFIQPVALSQVRQHDKNKINEYLNLEK